LGVFVCGFFFGQVGGGDAEGVEEECCSAGVELVEGDASGDLLDGELDGGAVFEAW
jgi:hypothetical protein